MQNILSNSYRYTYKRLDISATIKNQTFYLIICNDGTQLEAKQVNKIFERFYTETHSDGKGHLGLGLSISQTIIRRLSGELTASISGDIITFESQLPLSVREL